MSSTQAGGDAATQAAEPSTVPPMRFEVTTLPVADEEITERLPGRV